MRTIRHVTICLGLAALVLAASPAHAEDACGTGTITPLLAGQTIPAGTVTVYNDALNLYVRYETTMPWVLSDVHLAAAAAVAGIPQSKSGNPTPGRFAYSATFDADVTSYTVAMPIAGAFSAGQEIVVAAHAVVQAPKNQGGSQTAWGFGADFSGANWAMYIKYAVQDCGGGGGPIFERIPE